MLSRSRDGKARAAEPDRSVAGVRADRPRHDVPIKVAVVLEIGKAPGTSANHGELALLEAVIIAQGAAFFLTRCNAVYQRQVCAELKRFGKLRVGDLHLGQRFRIDPLRAVRPDGGFQRICAGAIDLVLALAGGELLRSFDKIVPVPGILSGRRFHAGSLKEVYIIEDRERADVLRQCIDVAAALILAVIAIEIIEAIPDVVRVENLVVVDIVGQTQKIAGRGILHHLVDAAIEHVRRLTGADHGLELRVKFIVGNDDIFDLNVGIRCLKLVNHRGVCRDFGVRAPAHKADFCFFARGGRLVRLCIRGFGLRRVARGCGGCVRGGSLRLLAAASGKCRQHHQNCQKQRKILFHCNSSIIFIFV